MTHLEIYQTIRKHIPAELLEKYDHLCYGEMAEVPELAQWSKQLYAAQEEWTRITPQEAKPFG
jgi:hypothetical protein